MSPNFLLILKPGRYESKLSGQLILLYFSWLVSNHISLTRLRKVYEIPHPAHTYLFNFYIRMKLEIFLHFLESLSFLVVGLVFSKNLRMDESKYYDIKIPS